MTIIYFIIVLGLLVLVHEWGHFIVARLSGIRVDIFSIGFGPRIFSYKGKHTEYRVSIIPLGGFVKLYGEDPSAEAEGDRAKAQEIAASPDAFSSKPMASRLVTVLAGPIMNLLLALILMPMVFLVGRHMPAILDETPVVLGVRDGSPAAIAGILKGDRIIKIEDEPMVHWSDVLNWVMLHPHSRTMIQVERVGQVKDIPIPITEDVESKNSIGYAGFEPHYFWNNDPVVGIVQPGSPAEKAGFKLKDRIVSMDGRPITTWTEMTDIIRQSQGKPLQVSLVRDGAEQAATVTPVFEDGNGFWMIGVGKYSDPEQFIVKKFGFADAVKKGWEEYERLFNLTTDVLGRLFTFNLSYKALGGPIQIAQASGAAAQSGLGEFLFFMAFLSMQLGVLNLLPIPVLDGGHVLFMAIETIRGRALSLKVRSVLTQIGMAMLLGLMVLITINDIDRIWSLSGLWERVVGLF